MFALSKEERQALVFILAVGLCGIAGEHLCKLLNRGCALSNFPDDMSKIDLNTADAQLLMRVSGIGKTMASRIVEYRDANFPLRSLEGVRLLKGMTEKRFERLRDAVFVR